MSYDTQNTAVRNAILAFAAELKTQLQSASSADYATNSGKLEGLTLNEVVELIAGTTGLTVQNVQDSLDLHIARTDNPHGVTAAQVGLDMVDNFASATELEAAGIGFLYTATEGQTAFSGVDDNAATLELEDGAVVYVELNDNRISDANYTIDVPSDTVTLTTGATVGDKLVVRVVTADKFMTTQVLWHVMDAFWSQKVGSAPATLDTIAELAAALENNPDIIDGLTAQIGAKADQDDIDAAVAALTSASVGLGNVANYAVATSPEAVAGLVTDKYMTPALTKAHTDAVASGLQSQIDAKATQADIDAAIAAIDAVTAADVGLGSVDNFATATVPETVTGTATNLFVTPAGVKGVRDAMEVDTAAALTSLETAFTDALASLQAS
jgi:hypothetical protein